MTSPPLFGSFEPLVTTLTQRVDTAADEMQQQIDALELLVLNRAALIDITQDGRKLQFTFTRRGQIYRVEAYADMSVDVAGIRKELLE